MAAKVKANAAVHACHPVAAASVHVLLHLVNRQLANVQQTCKTCSNASPGKVQGCFPRTSPPARLHPAACFLLHEMPAASWPQLQVKDCSSSNSSGGTQWEVNRECCLPSAACSTACIAATRLSQQLHTCQPQPPNLQPQHPGGSACWTMTSSAGAAACALQALHSPSQPCRPPTWPACLLWHVPQAAAALAAQVC